MNMKFNDKELEELTKQYYLENKQLKEKLDCDLKWAFKCDELTKENQKLKEQLKRKEDIINKASEILTKEYKENVFEHYEYDLYKAVNTLKKLLQILDNKGETKDE